jgi:hypothetical protein
MTQHVLLVEPHYYTQYPPLGLLKLSTYHKNRGDTTELVHGTRPTISREPDVIYVTSLFTWAWQPVWEAVQFYSAHFPRSELWLGGLYASLMPEHAALSGVHPSNIFKGVFCEAEDLLPDYSLVPDWNKKSGASIIFSSRGCIRSCSFCAVPALEGKINSSKATIKHLIWPGHKKVIFFDNNFFASRYWERILNDVEELELKVDFNQGLDARLISRQIAKRISRLDFEKVVRLSYDYLEMGPYVRKAINLLKSEGIPGRRILVYALYNFTDDPQDFFNRMRDILTWGAVCYPMRYEPLRTLRKNHYIAPKWDRIKLDAVQKARRIIGYGGAFVPHKGMLKVKVEGCATFEKAFAEFIVPLEVAR